MWSVCISRSLWTLKVSLSWTDSGLCIYRLVEESNFHHLHNSQCITIPTPSCLVYSFCACLLHSLTMWLIVSSLSLQKLQLLFYCVLSRLIQWVLALICSAIRLGDPFLSQNPREVFASYIIIIIIVIISDWNSKKKLFKILNVFYSPFFKEYIFISTSYLNFHSKYFSVYYIIRRK